MRMTDVCTLLTKKLYNDGKENDHEKNFNDMFVSGGDSNRMWSVCFKK